MSHYDDEHNLRKQAEKHKSGVDSATVMHYVIIPGFIGMIAAIILGAVIPAVGSSIGSGHRFTQIGQNISQRLNENFASLTKVFILENSFFMLLLFGFLLGVFIKYSFGNERVK